MPGEFSPEKRGVLFKRSRGKTYPSGFKGNKHIGAGSLGRILPRPPEHRSEDRRTVDFQKMKLEGPVSPER